MSRNVVIWASLRSTLAHFLLRGRTQMNTADITLHLLRCLYWQITISNKLYRCMTLKYFFYHQIFFQDSAQTEILTVFSNPKYTAWTFWNTEHEHFEILSMKLNCKYWECMDWNPRNTDVPASVFRRYCDTLLKKNWKSTLPKRGCVCV